MSGVGPLEPGEGTRAWDGPEGGTATLPRRPRGPLRQWYDRHRRAAVAGTTAAAVLTAAGYLYLTRPHRPPPPPPPYPSQVVDITYLDPVNVTNPDKPGSFSFTVDLSVRSGPPVTVRDIAQPYAGLTLTSQPRTPFRTRAGDSRRIVITMHVTQCSNAPESAGLPFLDVTLRNTRAKEVHSFILGQRYAQHLSSALRDICDNTSR